MEQDETETVAGLTHCEMPLSRIRRQASIEGMEKFHISSQKIAEDSFPFKRGNVSCLDS